MRRHHDCPEGYIKNSNDNCVLGQRGGLVGGHRRWAMSGFGDAALAPIVINPDNSTSFSPAAVAAIMRWLQNFSVIPVPSIGGDATDNVVLDAKSSGDTRISATDWVGQKARDGKFVVGGQFDGGAVGFLDSATSGQLSAPVGSQLIAIQDPKLLVNYTFPPLGQPTPTGAILAMPLVAPSVGSGSGSGTSSTKSISEMLATPTGAAVGIGAAALLLWWLL